MLANETGRFKDRFRPTADLLRGLHPGRLAMEQTDGRAFGWVVRLCAWLLALCGRIGPSLEAALAEADATLPWSGYDAALSAEALRRPQSAFPAAAALGSGRGARAPPTVRPESAAERLLAAAEGGEGEDAARGGTDSLDGRVPTAPCAPRRGAGWANSPFF